MNRYAPRFISRCICRFVCALAAVLLAPTGSLAYPLDGDETTGIIRLRGYRELQERLLARGNLKTGSLLSLDDIRLGLADRQDFTAPSEPDPVLSKKLASLLGGETNRYAIAVLDLSDLDTPHYFAHRPDHPQNPGSVGKLVVGLAWFQALADLYPEDISARVRVLRETEVVADAFIRTDSHEVPFWKPGDERIVKRPLRVGDRGNLYTYLDWMFSSSSNAAASMLMQQLVALRHFGVAYPDPESNQQTFFAETPRADLAAVLKEALMEPLLRNGFDPENLRQGGLFTQEGKRRIPGGDSNSTASELLRFLVRMEQGQLVDPWSSRELKRLMYLTDRRIRYASHPALDASAIYFKSGSLYQCQPEEGFVCGKYMGNVRNFMNSVAIVETREAGRELHYLVVVLSNVLRQNSAVAHQTLALKIHRLIESLHPVQVIPAETIPAEATPSPVSPAPTHEQNSIPPGSDRSH